jgi:hypothetical protein
MILGLKKPAHDRYDLKHTTLIFSKLNACRI